MRVSLLMIVADALVNSACGTTEKTVVVQPAPGATTLVPPSRDVTVGDHDE
jgi:hypothetical protein